MRPLKNTNNSCLVNSILEGFTRLKAGNIGGSNLDFLASLRISSCAGGTMLNGKSTETDQRNLITFFQCAGDCFQD